MLKAANTNVKGFTLYVVGEGIEKKVTTSLPKWLPRWLLPRPLRPDRLRIFAAPSAVHSSSPPYLPLEEITHDPRCTSVHKRILLKLSGEALMGDDAFGINRATIVRMVEEIAEVTRLGVQVAVVIGGGNIFRGVAGGSVGMDRATADYMGMLATVMNALALADAMDKQGLVARVMSAIAIEQVVEPYVRPKALQYLEEGKVVVFAAGTGNPFFTTDTAAALRGAEIGSRDGAQGHQGGRRLYCRPPEGPHGHALHQAQL